MGEEKSIRNLLPPEKHFRWRAGEITRLEAFCDVVFGFAITLLVVSLEVPHSFAELKIALRGFLPFGICFAQFVLIWLTHYRFSRRFGLEDPYTVFLNMVLLFLVLFYVYPLKFLFTLLIGQIFGWEHLGVLTDLDAAMLMKIYGIGFAAVFTLFSLMYHHAVALAEKLELNAIELYETRISMQQTFALMLFGLVSFFVAFRSPAMAGWIYMPIGIYFWANGRIAGKHKRKLLAPAAVETEPRSQVPAET